MYRIDKINTNGFEEIILSNSDRGDYCSVVPSFGANIRELILSNQSIIKGYNSVEEFCSNEGYYSSFLIPFPNRVKEGRYSFAGNSYCLPENDPPNALHGFFHNREVLLKEKSVGEKGAALILSYSYRGNYAGYPFNFDVEITLILNVGGLRCILEIIGRDEAGVPLGIGWHPYFRLGSDGVDKWKLKLPECKLVEADKEGIPTGVMKPYYDYRKLQLIGKRHFDNGFKVEAPAFSVELMSQNCGLKICCERIQAQDSYFQIYTPPDRGAIAIEPMSCAANSFNNGIGLKILKNGEKMSSVFRLSLLRT